MEIKVSLADFKKKRSVNSLMPLPKWYNKTVHGRVLSYLSAGLKLEACKYLCDKSKEMNTREEYGLKWAKMDVCDEIQSIAGIQFNGFTPAKEVDEPKTSIPSSEIIKVLHPFMMLAYQCLHNSNLHKDQIVYAYNNAQITMQDLRNIEELKTRLLNEKL